MKTKLLLITILMLLSLNAFCQKQPIPPLPPIILLGTPDFAQGEGTPKLTVHIDTDNNLVSDHSIVVDDKGQFKITYPAPLAPAVTHINYWIVNAAGTKSEIKVFEIISVQKTLLLLSNKETNPLLQNSRNKSVTEYKPTILNTNFNIPIARIKTYSPTTESPDKAKVAFFNSIGAGFGFSAGKVTEIRDLEGELIDTKFKNTFGMHLGILFSNDGDDDNIVAPVLTGTFLDFELGIGFEYGTLEANQNRLFFTIAYAIPLYKLADTNFYIWKSSQNRAKQGRFVKDDK